MSYLTKSKCVAGLQCERRLWREVHTPEPYEEPQPGSIFATGTEVGERARLLHPGGVLVAEEPWQHAEAVAKTEDLIADETVPAIFEAALEAHGVRVRVDILKRTNGGWDLFEVKSATKVKPEYLPDLSVQAYVCRESGLDIRNFLLVHVDSDFVRGEKIEWSEYFLSSDETGSVASDMPHWAERLRHQFEIIENPNEPAMEPGMHCSRPYKCEFFETCSAGKPKDWIRTLPRISASAFEELTRAGIESISEIPDDFSLTQIQERVRDCMREDRMIVAPGLAQAVDGFGPPAFYLDFETVNPGIPVYEGTSPYQTIPFQWSVHRADAGGETTHFEYLADGSVDPRRELAIRLVDCMGGENIPVVVYTSFEKTRLRDLGNQLPDLKDDLDAIIDRIVDLHAVAANFINHPEFRGSSSLKSVAPVLAPEVDYSGLDIADGTDASIAFYRIVHGLVDPRDEGRLRAELLDYCRLDTFALMKVHEAIREID